MIEVKVNKLYMYNKQFQVSIRRYMTVCWWYYVVIRYKTGGILYFTPCNIHISKARYSYNQLINFCCSHFQNKIWFKNSVSFCYPYKLLIMMLIMIHLIVTFIKQRALNFICAGQFINRKVDWPAFTGQYQPREEGVAN
jgi:hypothetical protein